MFFSYWPEAEGMTATDLAAHTPGRNNATCYFPSRVISEMAISITGY
jgi:hypothetical protein